VHTVTGVIHIPLAVEIKVGYNWMTGKEIDLNGYSIEL
jgi:hypothetical protein